LVADTIHVPDTWAGWRVHKKQAEKPAKASKAERQKYCSAACRKEHQKQKIVCEVCGKERKVTPTQATQGARFCSWKCARQVLNKPRPVVVCEQCGKECAVPPSRVRQGMRFCSYSCRSIWNITHGAMASPTSIELILYRMLEYLKVEYLSQYPIPGAGTVADAYVPALNLVLYADGDYWHALPKTVKRDQRQNKRLAELGYKFARLSESDLRTNPIAAVKAVLTG
jgi:G:T-mismatch repair DNA endonuclease (very short patch repair protein)